MTPRSLITCLLILTSGFFAFAKNDSITMKEKAGLFLLRKAELKASQPASTLFRRPNCEPAEVSGECIEYVAGSYASTADRLEAARACAGVESIECVKYVSGSYASAPDRRAAAKACKYNPDTECAEYVAGSYAGTADRIKAASACASADVECVKSVAGSYAGMKERLEAAKACSGQ